MFVEVERLKISLDRETVKWIDERVALKQFADRNEAIEYALKALRSSDSPLPSRGLRSSETIYIQMAQ